MSIHAAVADKRKELAKLCRRYDVARLEVFGSAARGADFNPDFLVEFDPNGDLPPLEQFFGLVDALRKALGRPVDMVETHELRNPHLRASMNESREVVFVS